MFGVRNVFDLIHIFTGHFNDAVENMNQSVFCMCSIHERCLILQILDKSLFYRTVGNPRGRGILGYSFTGSTTKMKVTLVVL